MKTVELPNTSADLADLLEQARGDDLVVRLADGSEFLLVAIDDFDREIERSRNNPKLMALLDFREKQAATIPHEEVKRMLGL